MDGVALRALLTQRYGLPTAAIDENMQKLVTLRGSFKPPRALAAPPERPPERAKKRKQLGSRLPATPQHPLRQAFSKAWWVWGGRLKPEMVTSDSWVPGQGGGRGQPGGQEAKDGGGEAAAGLRRPRLNGFR